MNSQLPISKNFHVIVKPIGPICNFDFTYCYYLEKESLHPKGENFRMKPDVLETYIQQYIEFQNTFDVTLAWQRGKPTLLGLDYFRTIVDLQKNTPKVAPSITRFRRMEPCSTTLRANFLLRINFSLGSVSTARRLHDTYRLDKGQKPTFDRVM